MSVSSVYGPLTVRYGSSSRISPTRLARYEFVGWIGGEDPTAGNQRVGDTVPDRDGGPV